ncbi:MAG: glycosyltransferase family 2 protein, partial [bacterium]|nr:glycosyltransferase family 2 protein [bacterium]
VQAQTYSNWELCLADGSDSDHNEVGQRVKVYQKNDKRIVYKKLEKNLGISENTNECIKMSTGDYIGLFDHDDVLHPSVLFENAKAICEHGADFLYTDEATFESPNIKKIITFHFKPDFAIDNLFANNYICHFSVFSRQLIEKAGMFRKEFDGSQDHDMILRLTANAEKIHHIPKLLYFWRSHPQSVAMDIDSKTYAVDAGKRAVYESIKSRGYNCTVESSKAFPTIYRIKYELKATPLVSIMIPNMNHKSDLQRCIKSILSKSTYNNYEIIVIENNSTEKEIFDYYKEIEEHQNIKVVKYDNEFNYSLINNFGAKHANGEYLVLLNNDTEVITPEWIEEMLMYAQRSDVGIVGAKLYYPDNTVQHGGVVVGLGGISGHTHRHVKSTEFGYMGIMYYAHNLSAVTAACLMVKKSLFDQINGLDDEFAVAYNDVDFCLRIRELDKLIVLTPYAELYHYESKSRGYENTPAKQKRFAREIELFHKKWDDKILKTGDPYYNPNFSLAADYEILYNKINSDN